MDPQELSRFSEEEAVARIAEAIDLNNAICSHGVDRHISCAECEAQ